MICTKCGANNQDGLRFCTSCGAPLSNTPKKPKNKVWPIVLACVLILAVLGAGAFVGLQALGILPFGTFTSESISQGEQTDAENEADEESLINLKEEFSESLEQSGKDYKVAQSTLLSPKTYQQDLADIQTSLESMGLSISKISVYPSDKLAYATFTGSSQEALPGAEKNPEVAIEILLNIDPSATPENPTDLVSLGETASIVRYRVDYDASDIPLGDYVVLAHAVMNAADLSHPKYSYASRLELLALGEQEFDATFKHDPNGDKVYSGDGFAVMNDEWDIDISGSKNDKNPTVSVFVYV